MNIIEAFIKFNGQLIILISGLSGCNKTQVAKELSQDFKLDFIDQHDYYIKTHDTKATLHNGKEIIDYDTDAAIDWDRFNSDITANKSVVVSGVSFPPDKLTFTPNYHIHLKISKQNCLTNRREYIKDHNLDEETEVLKFNKLTYPYYLSSLSTAKINHFININEQQDTSIGNQIFEYIIASVLKYLESKHNKQSHAKYTEHTEQDEPKKHSNTIDMALDVYKHPFNVNEKESGGKTLEMFDKIYVPPESSTPSDNSDSSDSESPIKNGRIMIAPLKQLQRHIKI